MSSARYAYHPRHYHLMAVGLARAGMPVVVVARPDERGDPPGDVPVRLIEGVPLGGRLGRFLSAPVMLRSVARTRPSLIQVNSVDLLAWAPFVRWLYRVPVTYDANEDYASYMLIKEWVPRFLRQPLSRLVAYVEPRLAARLDATTVADPDTGSTFHKAGVETLVVHNFPWLSFDPGPVDPVVPLYDITHHGSLPGYTRSNVVATAVELARRGVEASWCLATRGYGEAERQTLEDDLARNGVRQNFTLAYDRPFSEMADLVARSRIGFVPLPDVLKFRHNIPRKLFEFLAAGRPVVASDLPPIRRLVGDSGSCVLVRPGDARGYAAAIEQWLADPAAAEEAGASGRRLILEHMNADAEIEKYVALCRAVMSGV